MNQVTKNFKQLVSDWNYYENVAVASPSLVAEANAARAFDKMARYEEALYEQIQYDQLRGDHHAG